MAYNLSNMEEFRPNKSMTQPNIHTEYEGMGYPEPEKRRRWPKVLAAFLILILLVACGYIGLIIYNVANISTKPFNFLGLTKDDTGRTNILVLGVGDKGHAGEGLSDTMMVLSVDSRTNRVAQISIPRDMRVEIPGYGYKKINQANALGGVDLARQTVSNTLGIPIHYYVQTNFTGLKGMVDAVGGIDVSVKDRLYDPEYPCEVDDGSVCGIDIQPGKQHMDGAKALQYARCRKGTCGDDFGRAARQQEVINLLREKMTQWSVILNPFRLAPLTSALKSSIQTDLGSYEMAQLGHAWQQAQKHEPIRLVLHMGNGGYLRSSGDSSDLVPVGGSYEAIQERVQGIFDLPVQPTDLPNAQ